MANKLLEDLDFAFNEFKNGDVIIKRKGIHVTKLSGKKAIGFTADMAYNCFAKQQQLMARITGNYKRGNEHQVKSHPRKSKLRLD
jgi:hypothetical protein